jgi:hypothetical protein
LLFLDQYLQEGPGFTPITGDAFAQSSSCQTLISWATDVSHSEDASPGDVVLFCSKAAYMTYGTTTVDDHLAPLPLSGIANGLFAANKPLATVMPGVTNTAQELGPSDDNAWQSIIQINANTWVSMNNYWDQAMSKVATATTSTTTVPDPGDSPDQEETITTGQAVVDWINQGRDAPKKCLGDC